MRREKRWGAENVAATPLRSVDEPGSREGRSDPVERDFYMHIRVPLAAPSGWRGRTEAEVGGMCLFKCAHFQGIA